MSADRPGPARRAARILGMVDGGAAPDARPAPATVADVGDLPMRWSVSSDDLPPPFNPRWLHRPDVLAALDVLDSAAFATDAPDALREAGADAVASGLILLAEKGLTDPRRIVRQAARLVLAYFAEGSLRYDTLDADIGLVRRDGKPQLGLIDRMAERDDLVVDLSRQEPYSSMKPTPAAAAIRAAAERYQSTRWPRDREARRIPDADPARTLYRIGRLGLRRWLSNEATLARLISTDRVRR